VTRFIQAALSAAILMSVAACASPARMNAMIPDRTAETLITESSPLAKAISVGTVDGGTETNPMWMSEVGNPEFKQALENSLANHAMLADGAGRYRFEVTLSKLDQPIFGASFTVTASVRYRLIDLKTDAPVYEDLISLPYTANFSDAFLGVERLRLANEGAMRVNIAAFLKEIVARQDKLGALRGGIVLAVIMDGTKGAAQ